MTRAGQFAANPYYVLLEQQFNELHALIAAGRGDSEEADRLRDEMEAVYPKLKSAEQRRLGRLSADLYSLVGEEAYEPLEDPVGTEEALRAAVRDAGSRQDWEQVLALLRKGPAGLSPAQVAYVRARAYQELGHTNTALRFMQHAATQDPGNSTYSYLVMGLLVRTGRLQEAVELSKQYLPDSGAPTIVRVHAATVLFQASVAASPDQHLQNCEMISQELRQLTTGPDFGALPEAVRGEALVTLGFCYEQLGQPDAALDSFDTAIGLDPANDSALVARGLLRLEPDLQGAIEDFKGAIELGTPLSSPYLFLAHQAFDDRKYSEGVGLCEKGLRLIEDPLVQAHLRQLLGIARLGLKTPAEHVRGDFKMALDLDPLNEDLRRNAEYFEALAKAGGPPVWEEAHWPAVGTPDPKTALWDLKARPRPATGVTP